MTSRLLSFLVLVAIVAFVCPAYGDLKHDKSSSAASKVVTGGGAALQSAKAKNVAEASVERAEIAIDEDAIRDLKEQVSIVSAQRDESRAFQSDLLTTVYWSLGVVVTLFALLLGFNWWSGYRIYERERATLKGELEVEVLKQVDSLNRALDDKAAAIQVDIQKKLEIVSDELRADVKSKFDRAITLTKSLNTLSRYALQRINFQMHMADEHGNSAAVTVAVSMLSAAIDMLADKAQTADKPDYHTETALDFILKATAAGGRYSQDEIDKLEILLEKVPENLSGKVQSVRETFKNSSPTE